MEFKIACLVGLLVMTQVGCATKEKFVRLSEEVVPKTTAIYVSGIDERLVLTFTKKGFRIDKTTVAVTVMGAGVFVSPNNHVLTCAHLFDLSEITGVSVCTSDGQCTAGEILHVENRLDLALVQAQFNTPTPYARIGDPRKLRVGQEVLAVGSPLGFPFSVSHGIISALNRDELKIPNMTQSDAFINPGNSGGPLFNLKGEIIGINSRLMPPINAPVFTGLGFSVQAGQIVEFLTRVRGRYYKLGESLPRFKYEYWQRFLKLISRSGKGE